MKIIILAGGSGTRLFPLSTPEKPKQFLPLANGKPLVVNAVERFLSVCDKKDIIVVTGKKFEEQTKQIFKEHSLEDVNVIFEPCAKNTCPAIALGVRYCKDVLKVADSEAIFIVPSDHVIKPLQAYLDSVKIVVKAIKEDRFVTIGITPNHPDVGYGYIKFEKSVYEVKKAIDFKEKPSLQAADEYVKSGLYLWNAGMFGFNTRCFEQELRTHAPKIFDFYKKGYDFLIQRFEDIESISIDYALGEKSKNIYIVPSHIVWSDIGSWDAYYDFCDKDNDGNVILGNINAANCKNSLIISYGNVKINIEGQNNKIIVCSGINCVICERGNSQTVKQFYSI